MFRSGVATTAWVIVAGTVILTVLLFISPRSQAKVSEVPAAAPAGEGIKAMQLLRNMSLKNLAGTEKDRFDRLTHNHQFDSLRDFWVELKMPQFIALTAEEKAEASGEASQYFEAGNRYYNAVRFARGQEELPSLFEGAKRCFSKGLQLEPNNTDARIMLASTIVEEGKDPMKGISMLREIEAVDSSNVKLQLSFAFFSIKSGQVDKAISRFRKALQADSTYIEAYLHLADAYERQGDVNSTIQMLESYASRTDDVTARLEVKKYIDQLKKKQNH